ncbi:MAG: hypothetical protein BWY87_00704 [Deltaproteobacteria bacterium ADurb.Bin510]|nr:MAG: hypothetical protein BWY87_00704 [Deltaproteobacteria bacterium ADurb.Bin510]
MWLEERGELVVLTCRVTPNARKNSIEGLRQERLSVRLHAPAVEGKANQALVAYLAELLGISKTRLEILRGDKSREKTVAISGLDLAAVEQRLQSATLTPR